MIEDQGKQRTKAIEKHGKQLVESNELQYQQKQNVTWRTKKKGFYELAEYDDFINYQNPIELF